MKKIISLLLTIAMVISVSTAVLAADVPQQDYPQRFWDVPKDHWAFNYIAELVNKGVLAGYEDGSFRPDTTVTRAEWAKIMVLAAGLPANDNNVYFTDMNNHWANIYVNTAKDYLAAYTDGTFKPDQAAVREDVTVSMVKLKGYDVSNVDYSYLSQFTDVNSISNSLKAYVAVAVEKDLISGFEDGTFRGQNTLTRAEAATLLWRAFQYGNDNKVVDTPDTPVTTPPATTVTPPPTTTTPPTQTTEEPQQTPDDTVETPEPTEDPEFTPVPTEKPYIIDTVVDADVESEYLYTQDENDNIYYVTGSKIYKTSVTEKFSEEIFDVANLVIDTEEMTLDDFRIDAICYNKNNDSVLVQGEYETVNAIETPKNNYLYEIKSGEATALTNSFDKYDRKLIAILENGDIASDSQLYDKNTYEIIDQYIYHIGETGYCPYIIIEKGNEFYYCGRSVYGSGWCFCKYDFINTERLWSVDVDGRIGRKIVGINQDKVFVIANDEVYIYNYSGKLLNKIINEDFEVKDRKTFAANKMLEKLLITQNEDVIFYDTSAKAFRIISEN